MSFNFLICFFSTLQHEGYNCRLERMQFETSNECRQTHLLDDSLAIDLNQQESLLNFRNDNSISSKLNFLRLRHRSQHINRNHRRSKSLTNSHNINNVVENSGSIQRSSSADLLVCFGLVK